MITVNTLTVCDECACLSKLMMQYWRPLSYNRPSYRLATR